MVPSKVEMATESDSVSVTCLTVNEMEASRRHNPPTLQQRTMRSSTTEAIRQRVRNLAMSPQQQLQRLLAAIPDYQPADILTLLPLAAAYLSALCAQAAAFQQPQAPPQEQTLPDTNYLLDAHQIAQRVGKSIKWVRANAESIDFPIKLGNEHRWSAHHFNDWISSLRQDKRDTMGPALPPLEEAP